ncbi:hypothetical protein GCM10010222_37870 [Streptomyces tanashiensis]|uniref:tail fiber domain-containing protein n=1 Tax=Streptomyces tanashiensis TaxID=67367 RepID=UPI001676BCDD|nr:tail fiber domain-containing protein [Streptomyces tanashiensis]GGS92689.1 hypothetical protein GCM10010222_37870 [Streptomyces tanashiensis]
MRIRILGRRARAADDASPDPSAAGPRDTVGVAPVGAVNGFAVLDAVAALPVSTWRYLWEPEGVRHLGPMAQDWHAAFGFNRDDTRIPVVDGLGVALVCIQALQRHVEELRAEVAMLREAVATTPSEEGR